MSTALYRRYRPDSFADVIGQEHVTNPLMAALQKNRVNHAYLFSGPRGCGKTTSARILARCLNCAQGPTPTPCGQCDSCVELGRGGPGSLDVIEIDAASHGGVDDARDLRERATFAPVRDRYKIFIIDEAHMVTSAGFNALLKIVEEPPEHIKFIFATTEPDKVIGTIRSRTHHYPFRLVPPEPLMQYLELLCNQENVPVAPGVLSLVVRAGGGSVRDSLSVLDQLMAGAGSEGLDYELAVSLLGYTHASLLDDVVDAFAAQDASTVFSAVDRVVQTGHDPRRFVEDLLERFRDLIIVKAMPESAHAILRGVPEDQIARMQTQANQLGSSELSRAADITNQALTEMTGATSPRLHLELLCARILLPVADQAERGVAARVDRIERRLAYAGELPAGAPNHAPPAAETNYDAGSAPSVPSAEGVSGAAQVREALRAARTQPAPAAETAAETQPSPQNAQAPVQPAPAPVQPAPAPVQPAPTQSAPQSAPAPIQSSQEPRPQPTAEEVAPNGPQSAPTASPAPAAPQPEEAPASRDWGGTWGAAPEPEPAKPATPAPAVPAVPTEQAAPGQQAPAPTPAPAPAPAQQLAPSQPAVPGAAQPRSPSPAHSGPRPAAQQGAPTGQQAPAPVQSAPPAAASQQRPAASGATGSVEMFRRAWPEIMDVLKTEKKFLWMTVEPHTSLAGFDGRTLTVAFSNSGAMNAFSSKQENAGILRQCIFKVLGVDCAIDVTAGGSARAAGEPAPKVPTSWQPPADGAAPRTINAPAPAMPAAGSPAAPAAEPAPAQNAGQNRPVPSAGPVQNRQAVPAQSVGNVWGPVAPIPDANSASTGIQSASAATATTTLPARTPSALSEPSAQSAASAGSMASGQSAPSAGSVPSGVSATSAQSASSPASSPSGTSAPSTQSAPSAQSSPSAASSASAQSAPSATSAPSAASSRPVAAAEPVAVPPPAPGERPVFGHLAQGQPAAARPTVWEPAQASGAASAPQAPAQNGQRPAASPPQPEKPAAPSMPDVPQSPYDDIPFSDEEPPSEEWDASPDFEPRRPQVQVQPSPSAAAQVSQPAPAASQAPAPSPAGAPPSAQTPDAAAALDPNKPMSRYQRLLNQARAAEAQGRPAGAPAGPGFGSRGGSGLNLSHVEDIPSEDDLAIEDSGLVGRAAIERILGGRLIEEQSLDGS